MPHPQVNSQPNTPHFFKNINRSVLVWFVICYGGMYLFNAFLMKQIFIQFEETQAENIALQTLKDRNSNIIFFSNHLSLLKTIDLKNYIDDINKANDNIFSTILSENQQSVTLQNGYVWKDIDWDKIKSCTQSKSQCSNGLMQTSVLSAEQNKLQNIFVFPATIQIGQENRIILHFAASHLDKNSYQHTNVTRIQQLLQFLILSSFIFYILIGYGLLRPVIKFIEKIKLKELVSSNFQHAEPFELNHVRFLRDTLHLALKNKEEEEYELLFMQKAFISQQKEADLGRIVAQISHDLKSPLVVFESLLKENSYESYKAYYDAAKRSLQKMQAMINSLRQADQETFLNRVIDTFDPTGLLEEIKIYAEKKSIKCNFNIDNSSQKLFSIDTHKVDRSLKNLLRNAIEHANSQIEFTMKSENRSLVFEICDDGNGIHPDVLPKLFEWRNTNRNGAGTGIGLSYAKQIALAHGGDLEYTRQNSKTIFTLTLPNALYEEDMQSDTVQTPIAVTSAKDAQQNVKTVEKFVCFYITNSKKYMEFKKYFTSSDIKTLFTTEEPNESQIAKSIALYTDTNGAFVTQAILANVHVILNKQEDTPKSLADKLTTLYPHLKKS